MANLKSIRLASLHDKENAADVIEKEAEKVGAKKNSKNYKIKNKK